MTGTAEVVRAHCALILVGVLCAGLSGCGPGPSPSPNKPTTVDEVTSLPGYGGALRSKHYAGLVPVSDNSTDTTNQLFYYFVTAEENFKESTPTLIWLNGGPGASSLMGMFAENLGPQSISGAGTIVENPHRLSRKYNLMAVDNPVGAGFSYTNNGSYVRSAEEMRAQFVQGLRHFFNLHPDFLKNPLWITGESYAGKYIPHIFHELDHQITLDRSNKGQFSGLKLEGMIIGNGLYNASAQYKSIGLYAYVAGVIDEQTYSEVKKNQSACIEKIHDPTFQAASDYCENVTVRWIYNDVAHMPMYYDLGLTDLDLDSITASIGGWLGRADVKAALHVTGQEWQNHDEVGPVAEALMADFTLDSSPLVAAAVERGYRVALYNGVRDGSVCNHLANTDALIEMDKTWKFKGEYAAARDSPMWYQESASHKQRVSGFHKIVRSFSFTKILNTGHLVPTVVPKEFGAYIDWVTKYSNMFGTVIL